MIYEYCFVFKHKRILEIRHLFKVVAFFFARILARKKKYFRTWNKPVGLAFAGSGYF